VHNFGHRFHGRTYIHWCYDGGWTGWTKMYWYPPLDDYIYWSPIDGCWYEYIEPVYCPLDDLTDIEIDRVPPVAKPPVPVVPPK